MVTAPDLNNREEYYQSNLRSAGVLNDEEREYILETIIEAELPLEAEFLRIAKDLLYPTTASKFASDTTPDDIMSFFAKMSMIGNELAIFLNRISPSVRQLFLADGLSTQEFLEAIYCFYEIFESTAYEVGHVFKLNPFYSMMIEWREELRTNFPNDKFIALGEMKKSKSNNTGSKNRSGNKVLHQIEWHGTQVELGELLIQLVEKGWLDKLTPAATATIKLCFTKTNTMDQLLKEGNDPDFPYPQINTKRSSTGFKNIKSNTKIK